MDTIAPERQKAKPHKFASNDLIEAVKKEFIGIEGRIDVRYLWTTSDVHRFRVNCWIDGHSPTIRYSEFVHVIEEDGKLTIKRS